jgi:hypothetical protein
MEVIFEGVRFTFSVSHHYASEGNIPEVCVTVKDEGDNMVVVAFDRGGLTLLGDSIHLAVDGDEAYVS